MMPRTQLGKWAGILIAVFYVLLIALISGWNLLGLREGTPLVIIVEVCIMISGIAAFVTGTISLIKFKDRSPVVILAAGFGFIALLHLVRNLLEGKTKSHSTNGRA